MGEMSILEMVINLIFYPEIGALNFINAPNKINDRAFVKKPARRFELLTYSLRVSCSTAELCWHINQVSESHYNLLP